MARPSFLPRTWWKAWSGSATAWPLLTKGRSCAKARCTNCVPGPRRWKMSSCAWSAPNARSKGWTGCDRRHSARSTAQHAQLSPGLQASWRCIFHHHGRRLVRLLDISRFGDGGLFLFDGGRRADPPRLSHRTDVRVSLLAARAYHVGQPGRFTRFEKASDLPRPAPQTFRHRGAAAPYHLRRDAADACWQLNRLAAQSTVWRRAFGAAHPRPGSGFRPVQPDAFRRPAEPAGALAHAQAPARNSDAGASDRRRRAAIAGSHPHPGARSAALF